ncbi:hypothetical protein D5S18_33160 [Nocardia panacis]|uniref:ATP synthase subunit b n=1 Tax=Nocardia panacis TaxID=2340916 RepID=A0A3A4KH55_9NOCA|nr:hypothetical protein [Nocardia panacis]RJO68275.1 hypothetical protein D5S18_33160 [Nocardia panacis]
MTDDRSGLYDITWDWPVFLSQLFGFAVIVGVLAKWVLPPVRTAMRRAQDTIDTQMADSAKASVDLAAAERAFAAAVHAAEAEVARIHREAREDAEGILAGLRETAATETIRVRRAGLRNLSRTRDRLEAELAGDLTTAVLDRTESILRERLESPEAKAESIDLFLAELADGLAEEA